MREIEIKIIWINIEKFEEEILKLWAKCVWEYFQKRYVYDTIPVQNWKWIRLRDDWKNITLCYKNIISDQIDWTQEIETRVENFEKTNKILENAWIKAKSYQENKRKSYIFDDVNIEIDSRPMLETYIEIEAKTTKKLEEFLKLLNIEKKYITTKNTKKLYEEKNINLDSIEILKFE